MRLVNFRLITRKYIEHSFLSLTHLCYTFLIKVKQSAEFYFQIFPRYYAEELSKSSRLYVREDQTFVYLSHAIPFLSLLSWLIYAVTCRISLFPSFLQITQRHFVVLVFTSYCDKFSWSYLTLKLLKYWERPISGFSFYICK